jgi:hypothetical protein
VERGNRGAGGIGGEAMFKTFKPIYLPKPITYNNP